jgi:acyl-CoA thioester hydrolase
MSATDPAATDPAVADPAPTVRCREVVRWCDLDAQGVLNNAVYLTLFEQARLAYFRPLGVLQGECFPFLLVHSELNFRAPARSGDELEVGTRVTRMGTRSFAMSYTVDCGARRIADGRATLCWVDDALRAVAIPEPVRVAIRELEGPGLQEVRS